MRIALVLFVVCLVQVSLAQLQANQLTFLNQLFAATQGPSWKKNTNWQTTADPCIGKWAGVTCNAANTTVIELNFSGVGLVGSIPSTISALTDMTYFDMTSNQLPFPIPDAIWGLTNIANFYMSESMVTGSISPSIGSWTKLTAFEAYKNSLTGTLPPALFNIKTLSRFSVNNNGMTGTIPPAIANLDMTLLNLYNNNFTGTVPFNQTSYPQMDSGDFMFGCNCFSAWPQWCFTTLCQPCTVGVCNASTAVLEGASGSNAGSSASSVVAFASVTVMSLIAALLF